MQMDFFDLGKTADLQAATEQLEKKAEQLVRNGKLRAAVGNKPLPYWSKRIGIEDGMDHEDILIEHILPAHFGVHLVRNPKREEGEPDAFFADDLTKFAEIKCRRTTIALAYRYYEIHPRYYFNIDVKDILWYTKNQWDVTLFIWIARDHTQVTLPEGQRMTINAIHGVWTTHIIELKALLNMMCPLSTRSGGRCYLQFSRDRLRKDHPEANLPKNQQLNVWLEDHTCKPSMCVGEKPLHCLTIGKQVGHLGSSVNSGGQSTCIFAVNLKNLTQLQPIAQPKAGGEA